MPKEYIIYCDESESKGRRFSNFYGGVLVTSDHLDEVRTAIAQKKRDLNLFGEVKWSKVSTNYYKKYIDLMDFFFDLIATGKVKARIMFTQNAYRPTRLRREHVDNQYAILYYHFIRHAFGLRYAPTDRGGTVVRIYPDTLPLKAADARAFKNYLARLGNRQEFVGLNFSRENITEVISHEHDILQCLDVVLGAMNFRLTGKHLDKTAGARTRSDKTLAREKVYKHINRRIRAIYPNFNIGITTGHQGISANRFHHAYRHWCFRTRTEWR